MKIDKWAKTDKPNPFSYKTERSTQMLSNNRRMESYSFNKESRKTYQGKMIFVFEEVPKLSLKLNLARSITICIRIFSVSQKKSFSKKRRRTGLASAPTASTKANPESIGLQLESGEEVVMSSSRPEMA